MLTVGEYSDKTSTFGVILSHTKFETEIILVSAGQISSAYKLNSTGEYSYISRKAEELWYEIKKGLRLCTAKNAVSIPFELGASVLHQINRAGIEYSIETYNGDICGLIISGDGIKLQTKYTKQQNLIPSNIPYIKLTKAPSKIEATQSEDYVVVRSVAEIALSKKDVSWLKNKKYFIINDDAQAEQIFTYLDTYNGVIAYDTETTGLRINCFGKINSSYKRQLEEWNEAHPNEQIRADKLVGIIFCIEKDVSYYFPASNRKFKNLYQDKNSEVRLRICNTIKSRYMIGDMHTLNTDMADYIRRTPIDDWTSDIILMERVRNILETKHIVAHNGSFEYKVGLQYDIDTNLRDDTMLLHQIMYKFRSTTSNRGEPSNLKYLAQREFGIEQWELGDFFPDYQEDDGGAIRTKAGARGKKKQNSKIDFSYMDYEGTRVYAPTDGDITFMLFMKYKADMVANHKEQEYIYGVEVIVACAIGYMEFYGHRLDENKIASVRDKSKAKLHLLESEIRQMVNYSNDAELACYDELKAAYAELEKVEGGKDNQLINEKLDTLIKLVEKMRSIIDNNTDNVLNLASPAQVCKLFYDDLKIPFSGDKQSVAKKEVKALLKAKNEDGTPKYPVVHLYSEYKKIDTLLTKFFDNLPYYMYPGGIIFSSYGQISTATGRMSCQKPNAQQYPKEITNIVIARDRCVMLDADYSQIEYRVLVALSGEEHLARLFEDPDNDYHTLMASLMYGVPYASVSPKMRSDAKSFNFGIPYGMGFRSLAILLTGMSGPVQVEEAKEKYELYFKDQPKTRKFFENVKEMALVNKYTKTFWNRYRYYSFVDKEGNTSEAKKASALRQAGNAVIQGTAADVFKIAVARIFMYIRTYKLFGVLFITNMIHDEMLFEVNVRKLNALKVLADIGQTMQFKVNGFPPLYIGAGLGSTWAKAKGKMAEIHPHLLDAIIEEHKNDSLYNTVEMSEKDVLDYFSNLVLNFRRTKVIDYLLNPENHHKDLHPAIGNLINLQFTYGLDKEALGLSDDEYTTRLLEEFIKENNLNVSANMFKSQAIVEEVEENDGYSDEDEEDIDEDGGVYETDFALIDESSEVYGSSIHDLIRIFGMLVSTKMRVCGVDIRSMSYKKKEDIFEFLSEHACDPEDEGAMEIVFLTDSNILKRTGIFVNGIDGSELETRIKVQKTSLA